MSEMARHLAANFNPQVSQQIVVVLEVEAEDELALGAVINKIKSDFPGDRSAIVYSDMHRNTVVYGIRSADVIPGPVRDS